eukprot:TRINITY_DN5847_c0_g1_i2.p1 TRINITY_DN5847_c0_g1~~TRINITY_DN5847_c0_g1_i2.p1  ORF type:complete len:279 (-),score=35.75 TRINITY_DN5847_c0_g1_i2:130-966(-)
MTWSDDDIKYAVTHVLLALFYLMPIGMCSWRQFCSSVEHKGDLFWQRTFTAFMLLGCLVRLSSWIGAIFVMSGSTGVSLIGNFYWNLYPSFFFCSDYVTVLFTWMEIFHSTHEGKANLKPLYIYVSVVTYSAVIGIMIGDIVISGTGNLLPLPETLLQKVLNTFDGALYFIITVGYLVYGGGFYYKFYKNGPLLSRVKTHVMPRVKILTVAISICYTFRAVITIWNTWVVWPKELFWVIDLVYYLFLEILPNILMLIVLQHRSTEEADEGTSVQSGGK